jgi:hypothetical protein
MAALLIVATLLSLAPRVSEHPDTTPINTGSELREWCQAESEARFVGESRTAYNWTARHFERGNTLIVEGRWRVDGEDVVVECRVARGARREYATMDMRAD